LGHSHRRASGASMYSVALSPVSPTPSFANSRMEHANETPGNQAIGHR
jgi:hypothetical protein